MVKRLLISFAILIGLLGVYFYPLFTIPPPEQLIGKPCLCSVVAIGSKLSPDQPHYGYGTGFVIEPNAVITASHVAKTGFLDVLICGIWRRGELIKRSPRKLVKMDFFLDGRAVVHYYHGLGEFALIRVNTCGVSPIPLAKETGAVGNVCHWYIYNCSNRFEGLITQLSAKPAELTSPLEYFFGFFQSSTTKIFAESLEINVHPLPGSSGSPMLNNKGLVIGMVNAGRQDLPMVYGLTSDEIKDFMDENSNVWNGLK